jgi:hypothetical protein
MRVLDGVGSLKVTAAAKMRSSSIMSVSFSAQRAETLVMLKDKGAMARNYSRLEKLVERILPYPEVPKEHLHGAGRGLFRQGLPVDAVLDFLQGFDVSPRVLTANPESVVEYIRAQVARGELTHWTVAVTAGKSTNRLRIPGADLPLVQRTMITGQFRVQAMECELGVLVSPAHEAIGLSTAAAKRAHQRTIEEFRARGKGGVPKRASGEFLRSVRDPANGLLLVYPIDPAVSNVTVESQEIPILGYAVVFPRSDKAEPIQYRVNQVFLDQLIKVVNDEDEDEDDD